MCTLEVELEVQLSQTVNCLHDDDGGREWEREEQTYDESRANNEHSLLCTQQQQHTIIHTTKGYAETFVNKACVLPRSSSLLKSFRSTINHRHASNSLFVKVVLRVRPPRYTRFLHNTTNAQIQVNKPSKWQAQDSFTMLARSSSSLPRSYSSSPPSLHQ